MLLFSAEQMRKIETACEQLHGISRATLMDRAAAALLERVVAFLDAHPDSARAAVILCGAGNNGADGYTLAALCREAGIHTSVICVFAPESPLCRERAFSCNTLSTPLFSWEGADEPLCRRLIAGSELIVDCVFGIGYDPLREPDSRFLSLCQALSESDAYVISADIPSGLGADDGIFFDKSTPPALVFANETVTFSFPKPALMTPPGSHAAGVLHVRSLGIPQAALADIPRTYALSDESLLCLLPAREADTSKANYGRLLSLCGSADMSGAAKLAALGALRCGVGLLTCAAVADVTRVLQYALCEPIYLTFPETLEGHVDLPLLRQRLTARLPAQTAILIGCGFGTDKLQEELLQLVLSESVCPVVCDADAITILARRTDLLETYGPKLILTPHPGEMARLCATNSATVQRTRIRAAKELSARYGCVCVLKGHRTVTVAPDGRITINSCGNAGMAKAGMGDLLAGMLASLAAQGLPAYDAARLAVYLHARSADRVRDALGEVGFLPSDVAAALPRAFLPE